jgi:DNA-binding response OmpR family regulator
MPSSKPTILIIEDDRKLSAALVSGIESAGYEVSTAASAEEGFFLVHSVRPQLLLLDLTLPHRNGLDILRQIRQEDRVQGLATGADDYLGKPFSFAELLARIDALLRRFLPPKETSTETIGDLVVDAHARRAERNGQRLDLTAREFDLLLYLAAHRDRIVSREMLARDVWRESSRYIGACYEWHSSTSCTMRSNSRPINRCL